MLGFAEIRSFNELLRRTSLKQSKYAVSAISAIINKACHESELEISLYHIGDKTFSLIVHSEDQSISKADIDEIITTITGELNAQPIIEGYLPQLDFGFACFPEDTQEAETLINFARITLDNSAGKSRDRRSLTQGCASFLQSGTAVCLFVRVKSGSRAT